MKRATFCLLAIVVAFAAGYCEYTNAFDCDDANCMWCLDGCHTKVLYKGCPDGPIPYTMDDPFYELEAYGPDVRQLHFGECIGEGVSKCDVQGNYPDCCVVSKTGGTKHCYDFSVWFVCENSTHFTGETCDKSGEVRTTFIRTTRGKCVHDKL